MPSRDRCQPVRTPGLPPSVFPPPATHSHLIPVLLHQPTTIAEAAACRCGFGLPCSKVPVTAPPWLPFHNRPAVPPTFPFPGLQRMHHSQQSPRCRAAPPSVSCGRKPSVGCQLIRNRCPPHAACISREDDLRPEHRGPELAGTPRTIYLSPLPRMRRARYAALGSGSVIRVP